MKFNRTKATASLVLAFSSGVAFAQSAQSFVGPAVGLAISAQNTKTSMTSGLAAINGQSAQANDTATSLIGSWGIALSESWVATVGLAWDLNTTDFGKVNYSVGGPLTISMKSKEHLSLSFAPGYKVSPKVLVYGKLAHHQVKAEFTDTVVGTSTVDQSGTGVGLGVATMLTPQWEMRAEYESVNYNAQTVLTTSGKTEQSGVMLSLLYRF